MVSFLKQNLRYPCEAILLVVLFCVFRIMPVNVASGIGGFLGRSVGPLLSATRRARRSLGLVYPEKSERERAAIVRDMWDNLGRSAAEFPHLGKMSRRNGLNIELVGAEQILQLAANRAPAILVGAHMANWELMSVFLSRVGLDLTSVARVMNNKLSQVVIEHSRNSHGGARIDKNKRGTRQAMAALRRGGMLGILFDQKFNNGIAARLMGHEAMTAPGPALLSIQFGCPVIPVRIERIRGTKFRISCYPEVEAPRTNDKHDDVKVLTQRLNDVLEQWIRERPGQWLWLHRRWPEAAYGPLADRHIRDFDS